MALPIKANDTQEGCNPIASNCVIWQGPDIPCIKLCKGDTISDVSAKLAERLCTILEYVDVSAYDLSCFNPICPSPKDFQDLIQLLIDRICALNNIPVTPGGGAGCPDCVVPVAQCLQRPDALGNITASLQLRDYVILIGNEICSLTVSISSLDSRITILESAVTDIQTNCCSGGSGGDLTMPASQCLGTGNGLPIVDYLIALDAAFCTLETTAGNQNDINTALSYKCINGSDPLPSGSGTYSSLTGWVESPTNLAQAVQDLWLIVCEQNDAIISLQTQLTECCEGSGPPTPSCAEVDVWDMTRGTLIKGTSWIIVPAFSGTIPSGWAYPTGVTGATVVITDNGGNTYTSTYDVLTWINNPASVGGFTLPGAQVSYASTHYTVSITLTLVNGGSTCTTIREETITNTFWCSDVLRSTSTIGDFGSGFKAPRITFGLGGPLADGGINDIPTTYTVSVTPTLDGFLCPDSLPTLTGQYVSWEGPLVVLRLAEDPWVYGSLPTPEQGWTDPGALNNCIDGATGVVVIQQAGSPQITCVFNLPLVEI